MNGGQRSAVASIESIEQVHCFRTADLADDQVIGPVTQSHFHQIANRDLLAGIAAFEARDVFGMNLQLRTFLDDENAIARQIQLVQKRVLQRCFAGSRLTADQNIGAYFRGATQ